MSSTATGGEEPPSPPFWKKLPLPDGWEEVLMEDNRRFYVNNAAQTTQWIDPRDSVHHRRRPVDLPYGWDYAIDPICSLYFINHLEMLNTLDDPRLTEEYRRRLEDFQRLIDEEKQAQEEKEMLLAAERSRLDDERRRVQEERLKIEELQADADGDDEEIQQLAQREEELTLAESELTAQEANANETAQELTMNAQTIAEMEELKRKVADNEGDQMEQARTTKMQIAQSKDVYNKDQTVKIALEKDVKDLARRDPELREFMVVEIAAAERRRLEMKKKEEAEEKEGRRNDSESRNQLELGLELITMKRMLAQQRAEIRELEKLKLALLMSSDESELEKIQLKKGVVPNAHKDVASPGRASVFVDPNSELGHRLAQHGGKNWKGTLRRAAGQQDQGDKQNKISRPEQLSFAAKLEYFRHTGKEPTEK